MILKICVAWECRKHIISVYSRIVRGNPPKFVSENYTVAMLRLNMQSWLVHNSLVAISAVTSVVSYTTHRLSSPNS